MPPIPPQPVQLTCPACGSPVRAQIFTIIDVTAQPEMKQALLAGQLNLALCQKCGTATMIGAPMIYHDAAKQLCLVYFPQELNARPEEQEQFIGDATNMLLQNLPANTPRGYLLTPRRFMSLGSLVDAILEADGIPREALEQQRKRVDLISTLASALENEAQFTQMVDQHAAELDYEFFATLGAFIEASRQEGRNEAVQVLTALQEKLVDLTGFDGEMEDGVSDVDLKEAIERLQNVEDENLEEVVAELRPAIDYTFFAAWTDQIEALEKGSKAEKDRAKHLTDRRTHILEIVERLDKEAQAMFEAGADVLRKLLAASDPEAELRASASQIDEAFMLVLSANIAAAQRAGQSDMVERLESLAVLAGQIIDESLTPEERFIGQLLMAETPQESTKLLRQNAAQVTTDFVKQLNELADEQAKRGAQDRSDRLRQLAREAGAMLF